MLNGWLYLTGSDGVHGFEIWKTDDTTAGTVMVKDIYPGIIVSLPGRYKYLDGILIFDANDCNLGRELWKTDGKEAGTALVRDINPGDMGAFDELWDKEFFVLDDRMFFLTTD